MRQDFHNFKFNFENSILRLKTTQKFVKSNPKMAIFSKKNVFKKENDIFTEKWLIFTLILVVGFSYYVSGA